MRLYWCYAGGVMFDIYVVVGVLWFMRQVVLLVMVLVMLSPMFEKLLMLLYYVGGILWYMSCCWGVEATKVACTACVGVYSVMWC